MVSIYRDIQEPIRSNISHKERWNGQDKGLIQCWEVGRKLAKAHPEMAKRAKRGELPYIENGWKGGISSSIKLGWKYGTLFYLAEWQGLRGDNLNVNTEEEVELICRRTDMRVIYTADIKKYG